MESVRATVNIACARARRGCRFHPLLAAAGIPFQKQGLSTSTAVEKFRTVFKYIVDGRRGAAAPMPKGAARVGGGVHVQAAVVLSCQCGQSSWNGSDDALKGGSAAWGDCCWMLLHGEAARKSGSSRADRMASVWLVGLYQ